MSRPRSRYGFTLIELLVVIAIIAILIGLLVPAVQKVREAANAVQCGNHLHQLAIAMHNCHDQYKRMPPGLGWFPSNSAGAAYGTAYLHLLPYIEQGNLYNTSLFSGYYFAGNHNVFTRAIPILVCPSDPSQNAGLVPKGPMGLAWGATSYALNAQVVCQVLPNGMMIKPDHCARILASFPDGSSNTILFAEKYAYCTNSNYPEGGNLWAYWLTGTGTKPWHPGFAVSWNGYSYGPGSKFQHQPHPWEGSCDPTLASTPHAGGIHLGMVDGSVRFLSPGISPYTWWHLTTPAGGETIAADGF